MGGVRWSVTHYDGHRLVSVLAFAALSAAAALAILGLPTLDTHGPLHSLGIMDPLCGGTRAVRYAVLGQVGESWRYNPLGLLVVIASALATLRAAGGLLTHRWIDLSVRWTTRRRTWAVAAVVGLGVLLEVRQQGRVDLLLARP